MIAVAVGLPFHELDLGVGALQGASRDWIVVVVQDSFLVLFKGLGKLFQHANTRGAGASDPVLEKETGLRAASRFVGGLPSGSRPAPGAGSGAKRALAV